MPLKVTVGSAAKDVSRGEVTKSGVQKRMVRIEAYNGGAWKVVKTFVPPMGLSITPSFVLGERGTVGQVTSSSATATPSGGTGPYTYAWSKLYGDDMTVLAPTSATTAFRKGLGAGESASATYRCTATDKNGLTATANVGVSLINYATGN